MAVFDRFGPSWGTTVRPTPRKMLGWLGLEQLQSTLPVYILSQVYDSPALKLELTSVPGQVISRNRSVTSGVKMAPPHPAIDAEVCS